MTWPADSRTLPTSQLSYEVNLPANKTLYGRLYAEVGGNYKRYQDITFSTGRSLS